MQPQISIIVPLFNEEDNVAPLARQVLAAFQNEPRPLELVLVDDASTDGTWKQIIAAHQADPRVRGLRHARNSGQSAALWTGFRGSCAPIIMTLDGDLQNDPADLPRLLAGLEKYDVVCGMRTARQDNFLRRTSSKIARAARKAILGVDFRDTGCALRVFKRTALDRLFAFNGFHRFMPVLAHSTGSRVCEIPVNHRPRVAGVSKYGIWNRLGRGIVDLFAIAWYQKRQIPAIKVTAFPEEAGTKIPKYPNTQIPKE
ncbi:MAG: glycosyl transferase group 2 family protein [Pedosphaera sp.]|nr:glycosyl transferase group 2 family protein [Pedosphaera sp.]